MVFKKMFGKKKKDPATFETNVSTKTMVSDSSATTISTKNTAPVSGKFQYKAPAVDTIPEPVNAVEEEMENNTVEEMRDNEVEDTKTETAFSMDEPAFTKSKSIKSTRTASVVQVEDVLSKSTSADGISSNVEEQESDVIEDEEEKYNSVSASEEAQSMESDGPSPSITVTRISTLVAGIKLPVGAKSGELIDIEHDGKRKTITVPRGFKGGDEYDVKLISKKVDEEEVGTGMFCGCA